jgi:hypothetical protein
MSDSASVAYTPIPSIILDDGEHQPEELETSPEDFPLQPARAALSVPDKWRLTRPLLGKYMLPLCMSALSLLFQITC